MTIDEANWQLTEWLRQVREANKAARRHTEKNRLLGAENAKLREYAKMCAEMVGDVGCDHCLYRDLCDTETVPMCDGCRLWEEMRELGVEVGDVN